PGRPLGFGCGHPDWGAHSDRNAGLERRVRWREGGHTPVTMEFHREVFAAPNLLGIFAGHTHRATLDVVQGVPQFVTNANATAASLHVEVLPA
ncbi:MAG: metallophosphoesterase, partial [Verrucomicrobia bacterium]|nr:metallophosphoesterase [Verrucomicrobiota bacterium]